MEVKVLLDSINPYTGTRLTTIHASYPQFIHQQVLTHRMFSRNSSSLRAISFDRATEEFDLVFPTWTEEKKGMQGKVFDSEQTINYANKLIQGMYEDVHYWCEKLEHLGIHHQDINNYLRPFQNIETVITATEFENFFNQRLVDSVKPDMQKLAQLIKEALEDSRPKQRVQHIPLSADIDITQFDKNEEWLISAARLARISYFKWTDDPNKDLDLAKKLIEQKHPSPFEHVAFAQQDDGYYANFKSWRQLRSVIGF